MRPPPAPCWPGRRRRASAPSRTGSPSRRRSGTSGASGHALVRRDREVLRLAGLDLGDDLVRVHDAGVDVAAHQRRRRLAAGIERHVLQLDLGRLLEQVGEDVVLVVDAGAADRELPGLGARRVRRSPRSSCTAIRCAPTASARRSRRSSAPSSRRDGCRAGAPGACRRRSSAWRRRRRANRPSSLIR